MKYLFKITVLVLSFFYCTTSTFSQSISFYQNDSVGRVGHCSAVLLSERIALLSAHCLLHENKSLKPDAHEFIIDGKSIDIEHAVLGSSVFALDTMYNPLVLKDWAFIILKPNTYTINRFYMNLSNSYFSSYLINHRPKTLKVSSLNVIGLNEDLNQVSEVCNVYNSSQTDLLFTTCKNLVGGYSGVIFDSNYNLTAIMNISVGYYYKDPKLPTSIKSVAIPVTDSMIKTYQAIELSVKRHPVVTTKNILSSLLGVNYLDDTSSDLVVFNIKYDQKTDSKEAVIKALRSLKLINKPNGRFKDRSFSEYVDPIDDPGIKRRRVFRR